MKEILDIFVQTNEKKKKLIEIVGNYLVDLINNLGEGQDLFSKVQYDHGLRWGLVLNKKLFEDHFRDFQLQKYHFNGNDEVLLDKCRKWWQDNFHMVREWLIHVIHANA